MARPKFGPDENWEGTYDEMGWIPASYLERFAICLIDGGCTAREANVIANHEEQLRGAGGYFPGMLPGLASTTPEPSRLAYSRKVAGG